MTFYLDSGLEIRVPNSHFMTPFVDVDRSGKRVVDKSKREFLMNALSDQPATLGRYFLTAAYLMVNHDANSFTLWQANPTTSSNLVPVHDEESASECSGDVPGLVQASITPTDTPQDDTDKSGDGDISDSNGDGEVSPAVIGGAVGGAVGGLAIVAGTAAFLLVRRGRKQRENQVANDTELPPSYPHNEYKYPHIHSPRWGVQEVAGSEAYVHEVAGSEGQRFELDAGEHHRRG